MILITAAGGNTGRELIPALAATGAQIRALRGTPGPEAEQQLIDLGATEVVSGDMTDPAVIRSAMKGVDAVFHVSPTGPSFYERDIGFSVIDAAMAEDVEHVVYSSVLHPIISDLLQHDSKRLVEERLVSSPLKWTILQPADYMQMAFPATAFETGELPMAWAIDYKQTAVDLVDVAEVATKVLTEGAPHHFARYELCSGDPQSFNAYDLAEIAGRVCGREITVKPVSTMEMMGIWSQQPGPPKASPHAPADAPMEAQAHGFQVVEKIVEWYNAHDFMGNPNVLRWLLGREPTTLEEFLERLYRSTTAG